MAPGAAPALVLSVRRAEHAGTAARVRQRDLRCDGLHAVERGGDVYVSEGSSVLHIEERHGRGEAHLAPAFSQQPLLLQHRFWAFGILKLLRGRGLYGLHAAAMSRPRGSICSSWVRREAVSRR